jgi:hypothetical protein
VSEPAASPGVYRLRAVLHAVSPLIWRRLLVSGHPTSAAQPRELESPMQDTKKSTSQLRDTPLDSSALCELLVSSFNL